MPLAACLGKHDGIVSTVPVDSHSGFDPAPWRVQVYVPQVLGMACTI